MPRNHITETLAESTYLHNVLHLLKFLF